MRTLIVMAVLAAAAFGFGEFGVQVGYWLPTGDAGDDLDGNFYFGGQYIYHMAVVAVEGSVGYTPLKWSDELEGVDYSGSIIPVTIGIRSYSSRIYAAGGLEMDMMSGEINDVEDENYNGNKVGGYLGAGIIVPMAAGDVDISAKLHFVDFDDMWVGIQGGINF